MNIQQSIEKRLSDIEKEHDVDILLAIESGSRAYGFESIDSDYDVRFIYRHKFEWYINVLPKKDIIEIPDDYVGWDIRKTLFLMNKSNPCLFEWLHSPIIYRSNKKIHTMLLDAAQHYFSPLSFIYHYLSMASKNYKEYLNRDIVKLKKYFYVLRALLACLWVKDMKTPPPMEFEILMKSGIQDTVIISVINELLLRKKSGNKLGESCKIDVLNEYIEKMITYFKLYSDSANEKPSEDYLNNLFYNIISERMTL